MCPLRFLRRLIPRGIFRYYHRLLAWLAAIWYGRPSRHVIVIGVTGTDGKTTTATLITELLQASGAKVGLSSSVWYQVADHRWFNESHMTMPGRFALHRLLRQMVNADCQYAVIEASSEGLRQNRHIGIDIDVAVVTNVSREHLEAHGSFEAYRKAKGLLFSRVVKGGDKHLFGKTVKKMTIVNLDDPSAEFFLRYWAEEKHGVTLEPAKKHPSHVHVWAANAIHPNEQGSGFVVEDQRLAIPLLGRFNITNALQAIAVARAFAVPWETIVVTLAATKGIPGRLQELNHGQPFRVIVDYAVTPAAMEQLFQTLPSQNAKRIIAVFGAAGGGRDKWKRPELGAIAARYADTIILTTDDPYDEDPASIAAAIQQGIPSAAGRAVLTILDRREAIQKAVSLAQPGDVIAITGMGAETSMMVKGKKVPWSDAEVVTQELQKS